MTISTTSYLQEFTTPHPFPFPKTSPLIKVKHLPTNKTFIYFQHLT
jgi:hypothetical protein